MNIAAILFTNIAFLFSGAHLFAENKADTSGYYVSFDSTKIYYEVKGSGAPVILVHGFMNSGEAWKRTELYNLLQTKGFQVITLDMRGNGKSDKPHISTAYANDAEAKDIICLANLLLLRSYDLVGYSRGSIIAARLLVMDKRIGKAVIGGMGTDFTNPEWPRRKMFYNALMGEPVKELEGVIKYIKEAKLDQMALALMQKEQPSTSARELKAIEQPVLVIIGESDEDKQKARDLAGIFKKSEYALVPGDHGSALRTKEFAETVVVFLNKKTD